MKLTSTRLEYEFSDASGWRFHVVAEHDPEFGWNASVSMYCNGMRDAVSAVQGLGASAEHFLRTLKDAAP